MLGTELAVAIQDLRAKILENVIHANVCLVVYRQLPINRDLIFIT